MATSFYYIDHFRIETSFVATRRHLTEGAQEARLCPNENLGASGAAGKLHLRRLYCSERREPSGRFSWDIAEAIQHQAFALWQ